VFSLFVFRRESAKGDSAAAAAGHARSLFFVAGDKAARKPITPLLFAEEKKKSARAIGSVR